jgi:uncharacterized membrane protein
MRRILLLAFALVLATPSASANAQVDVGYSRVQVFSAALRYLRIDLGYEVTEQNADAAYLLFRYKAVGEPDARFGAFEIVETKTGVRLWVKLPQMPSYHEQVLKDGLMRKLRSDYGDDTPRTDSPKPDANKPDATKPDGANKAPSKAT